MSADCLYGVWVEERNGCFEVYEVGCSTNCFPKPVTVSRSGASLWMTLAPDEIAERVAGLCRAYDGGSLFEKSTGRKGLTGAMAWKRWRNRFRRAGGPDIGEAPSPSQICYSLSDLAFPPEESATLRLKRGQELTPELIETIVASGQRVPVSFDSLGMFCDGTLGFRREDGEIGVYCRRKARYGFRLPSNRKILSRVSTTIAPVVPRAQSN